MNRSTKYLSAVALACAAFSTVALAQIPGEWKYTISTDPSSVPQDMRVNFPTVSFNVCRSAEDFATGRAFSLQTVASSAVRCPSTGFERIPEGNRGEKVSFTFSCDEGKTLSGRSSGRVSPRLFAFEMTTEYPAPVAGVSSIKQTMRGGYIGPCKEKKDADDVKVPD